jgi:hypothetical protein
VAQARKPANCPIRAGARGARKVHDLQHREAAAVIHGPMPALPKMAGWSLGSCDAGTLASHGFGRGRCKSGRGDIHNSGASTSGLWKIAGSHRHNPARCRTMAGGHRSEPRPLCSDKRRLFARNVVSLSFFIRVAPPYQRAGRLSRINTLNPLLTTVHGTTTCDEQTLEMMLGLEKLTFLTSTASPAPGQLFATQNTLIGKQKTNEGFSELWLFSSDGSDFFCQR